MKKRTNLLALVLSLTAITFTLFRCSSDTGTKKEHSCTGKQQRPVEAGAQIRHQQMRALMSRCFMTRMASK